MKKRLLCCMAAVAIAFTGCAKKPTFFVDPEWTEKPTSVTVEFTKPMVENQDDAKDDLEEYADNFSAWFKAELTKDLNLVTKNSVAFDVVEVNASDLVHEKDSIQTVEFNMMKPMAMDGDGYYLVFSNVNFSRREDAYENAAYNGHVAANGYGAPVNPGTNSMATAGATIEDKGLWIYADYAFYNAKTGNRVAFGHWNIKSKFTYAMTRGDWEKCVLALVKKTLARTPVLKK